MASSRTRLTRASSCYAASWDWMQCPLYAALLRTWDVTWFLGGRNTRYFSCLAATHTFSPPLRLHIFPFRAGYLRRAEPAHHKNQAPTFIDSSVGIKLTIFLLSSRTVAICPANHHHAAAFTPNYQRQMAGCFISTAGASPNGRRARTPTRLTC